MTLLQGCPPPSPGTLARGAGPHSGAMAATVSGKAWACESRAAGSPGLGLVQAVAHDHVPEFMDSAYIFNTYLLKTY